MISILTPTIRPAGLEVIQEALKLQSYKDFEWLVEIGIPPKHDLNAAYNRMLRRARGELIVSIQDYVGIEPDGLEKFWIAYQENPDTFFTAPLGKKLGTHIKWDWRIHPEAEMSWQRWEIDWGAAPLEALKKIGGFDEALDEYWSMDNVSVGHRANIAGYKFMHLPNNPAVALDHDQFIEHPFRDRYNPDFVNQRMGEIEREETKLDNGF